MGTDNGLFDGLQMSCSKKEKGSQSYKKEIMKAAGRLREQAERKRETPHSWTLFFEALARLLEQAKKEEEDPTVYLNRLLDAEEEKERKKKVCLDKQIERCRKAYNQYQDCEPRKNAVYQKEFHSEGGILDCMNKYHDVIDRLLSFAETPEKMQLIIWGNGLQYLKFALDRLKKESDNIPIKKLETTEACKKYLTEERRIPLEPHKIEEVINDFNREYEIERTEKKRRLKYEKIQQELMSGTAAKYMQELSEGICNAEEDMQEVIHVYCEKAHKLDDIFKEKILSVMNQPQED